LGWGLQGRLNEIVASNLARALGLSAPAGAIVRNDDGHLYFVSLRFGGGVAPPPVIPPTLYASFPSTCAGIVAFDTWIGNIDRHIGNLAIDGPAVALFDHGLCLGGKEMPDTVIASADHAITHCLYSELTTAKDLRVWIDRITTLGPRLAEIQLDQAASTRLLKKAQAATILDWVKLRTTHLESLLKAATPTIADWGP
jgi:hypothetical protein